MQKALLCLAVCLPISLLAGCSTSRTVGLGEETGSARLAAGLRLLESDDGECAGSVQLLSGVRGDSDELRITRGQNATFEVEGADIAWACLDAQSAASDTMECPAETTHVRVTAAAGGREVLFECYG